MNTRKGQVGVALAALLVVACGDAAVGMVMEDGGGVVDDLGGMLVDMGMGLVDAGHQVSDAGGTMRDMGERMDSAVAQGPGPWTTANCTEYTATTTTAINVVVVTQWHATFAAPESDRWEVETCVVELFVGGASVDANNDGCTDTQPPGSTCVSDGPRPIAQCYYGTPARTNDGQATASCGQRQTLTQNGSLVYDVGSRNTVRYRRL